MLSFLLNLTSNFYSLYHYYKHFLKSVQMIQTIKFRLNPTPLQEKRLSEIFTIYNRVKRIGYKLFFQLKDTDFFKHSGITSFKTSEIARRTLLVKNVLNSATGAQSDNLRADLSICGKIEDYHKFWNCINISNVL